MNNIFDSYNKLKSNIIFKSFDELNLLYEELNSLEKKKEAKLNQIEVNFEESDDYYTNLVNNDLKRNNLEKINDIKKYFNTKISNTKLKIEKLKKDISENKDFLNVKTDLLNIKRDVDNTNIDIKFNIKKYKDLVNILKVKMDDKMYNECFKIANVLDDYDKLCDIDNKLCTYINLFDKIKLNNNVHNLMYVDELKDNVDYSNLFLNEDLKTSFELSINNLYDENKPREFIINNFYKTSNNISNLKDTLKEVSTNKLISEKKISIYDLKRFNKSYTNKLLNKDKNNLFEDKSFDDYMGIKHI